MAYLLAMKEAQDAEPERKYPPRSLSALIEAWYRSNAFLSIKLSTQTTYRRILEGMRAQPYALFNVMKFTPKHIRAIVEKRSATPARANHILRMFRLLFSHAVDFGWRDDDPTSGVKRLKTKEQGVGAWTEEQISQYEATWPLGTRQRLAFSLLLYTGQRRSDVVEMGPSSIRGGRICLRQIKTGTYLEIPIHPLLQESLDHCAPHAETFIRTALGKKSSSNGFYNQFVKWRDEAGLPAGLTPHGLRKAVARRLAEAGCTTHQIAAITGHGTLKEVDRYTREANRTGLADAAMKKIGG